MSSPEHHPGASARPLQALALVALVEAVALVAYGVYDIVQALRLGATGPTDVSNGPAITLQVVILVAFGAALAIVARGWQRAQRWARAPFIVAQVLGLAIGIPLAQSGGAVERIVGVATALVCVVGIVLALTPQVSRALGAVSGDQPH